MLRGKVYTVDMRERTTREKSGLNMASRMDLSMREAGGGREER